jgi:hypothetical protein
MKKVLKQLASELEYYVKAKHTQEECIGFIDGFERANELFALYSVSQQSELLDRLDKIENWAYNNAKNEDLDFLNKIFRSNCG